VASWAVDGDYVAVALADDYLCELRFRRRRAVSTAKACADNLALFLWLVEPNGPLGGGGTA
jgi:hypothetical protein